MSYLEELLPEFRKGAKIRKKTWDKGIYIYIDKNTGYPQGNGIIYTFQFKDLVIDSWELYQEPEPEWDSIIKNKCLCWFWDNPNEDDIQHASFLKRVGEDGRFENCKGYIWKNCHPVRRDEVTFYEDRKDE